MAGKGDSPRKVDTKKYEENYDKIFRVNKESVYPDWVSEGSIPLTIKVEDYAGYENLVNIKDFHCTGVSPPSWEEAKDQVKKYGVSSLGTIGYFRNPHGMVTDASRFKYYLIQENKNEN